MRFQLLTSASIDVLLPGLKLHSYDDDLTPCDATCGQYKARPGVLRHKRPDEKTLLYHPRSYTKSLALIRSPYTSLEMIVATTTGSFRPL